MVYGANQQGHLGVTSQLVYAIFEKRQPIGRGHAAAGQPETQLLQRSTWSAPQAIGRGALFEILARSK